MRAGSARRVLGAGTNAGAGGNLGLGANLARSDVARGRRLLRLGERAGERERGERACHAECVVHCRSHFVILNRQGAGAACIYQARELSERTMDHRHRVGAAAKTCRSMDFVTAIPFTV